MRIFSTRAKGHNFNHSCPGCKAGVVTPDSKYLARMKTDCTAIRSLACQVGEVNIRRQTASHIRYKPYLSGRGYQTNSCIEAVS